MRGDPKTIAKRWRQTLEPVIGDVDRDRARCPGNKSLSKTEPTIGNWLKISTRVSIRRYLPSQHAFKSAGPEKVQAAHWAQYFERAEAKRFPATQITLFGWHLEAASRSCEVHRLRYAALIGTWKEELQEFGVKYGEISVFLILLMRLSHKAGKHAS